MRLARLSNISPAKAISLAALIALAIAVAIGFLADSPTGATASNAGGSDSAALHMPIPAQYTAQCSNGIAVPNPADNPGLVADCAALLASKETLEGTEGNLNWLADRAISDWDGIIIANNRVSSLGLHGLGLSGEIPAELGNLANLMWMILINNHLSGEIPAELGNLTNLRELDIRGSNLTGEIPAELGNLTNIRDLRLSSNQLTGEIPTEMGNLANLRELWLFSNQLTGEIPAEMGNLANLRKLYLSNNQLTGAIPAELGSIANLRGLYLSNNQLTGVIPPELGNLANLTGLGFSGNQLTGVIPPELGNLASLERLVLSNNQLMGAIPTELGNLANLKWLYLNDNQLTDAIPTELGNLANLLHLHLHGNQLTGEIPTDLGNIPNLEELHLNGNQLTGCIPRSLHAPLGDEEIARLGLPICAATDTDRIAELETQIDEHATVIAALQAQLAEHASRLAALEGNSTTAPPATPTATPSPTPTSVAGTSGNAACIERLADSGSVSGVWVDNCLSANAPDDGNAYYARFYTFTLDAAANVTITLSAAKPPYIYLLEGVGKDGKVMQDAGDSSQTSQTITASLQAGSYTIEASTWNPNVTGDFTLTLNTGQ